MERLTATNCRLLFGLILLVGLLGAPPLHARGDSLLPSTKPAYSQWRDIALTECIAMGRAGGVGNVKSWRDGTVSFEMPVRVTRFLKGSNGAKSLKVEFGAPAAEAAGVRRYLDKLRGKEYLFFLDPSRDLLTRKRQSLFHFSSREIRTAARPSTPELFRAVAAEVKNQARINDHFHVLPAGKPDGFDPAVRQELTRLTRRETEQEAFDNLVALGPAAVPALIRHIDDDRILPKIRVPNADYLDPKELPSAGIAVKAPPGSIEAYNQYGPDVVTDAVILALSQLVKRPIYVMIINGSAPEERKNAVSAWRCYLVYELYAGRGGETTGHPNPSTGPRP